MYNYNPAMVLIIAFQYWADFRSWYTDQKLHAKDALFQLTKNPICAHIDDEWDK